MSAILKAGTLLFHGTDNDDWEENSVGLRAYSWLSSSRSVAERFAMRSGGWGGQKRIVQYRLAEDVSLPEILTAQDMRAFADDHNIDMSGVEGMRESADIAGIPGWVIPHNYSDGDDILLGNTSVLEYVDTAVLCVT
jgi:hypothetical protein